MFGAIPIILNPYGFRPVVCLKSNVNLEKVDENTVQLK